MNFMIDYTVELKKGAWSPEEDHKLIAYIHKYGPNNWSHVPKSAGLSRSGKSCRLRWVNYLRPDLKRGRLTADEIETITRLHKSLGNKWTQIAEHLPGRTDNEIKNFWHLSMKKRSKTMHHKKPSSKTSRENKKVKEEKIAWASTSYATSDELYSEINSSPTNFITKSIDFPIAESYSPSKVHSTITMDTKLSPCVSHQGASQVEDSSRGPFWIEDLSIPDFIPRMSEVDFEDHEIDSPYSTPSSQCDEATSFWFNILMDAERLGAK